ncbi:peptidylprolyl isomerase [Schlesneria paludicola]|uniref:peptidylprolyl isomerase n=1 Tax=Schlesneria paludicola TaxID=360056 RepID=UPI00029A35A0|nr:peptidyl-prolyl cis-trans isomerase [Schlesneria paludicola]
MHRALLLLPILLSCFLQGCNSLQKKHDHPVMIQAPQRVAQLDKEDPEDEDIAQAEAYDPKKHGEGTEIEQVGSMSLAKNPWDEWKDDTTIFNSQVAATVNGAPILNGDILDPNTMKLKDIREKMRASYSDPALARALPVRTPEDYEKIRYSIIQQEIPRYVMNKVLVEHLKAGLKPEQLKLMDGHIDETFEKEMIPKLKKELNVTNRTELELALNKQGTSLQTVKDNFALGRLAQECVAIKSDKPEPIDRPDLRAYYQSHKDKFLVAARVKWQQIQVSVTPELNKTEAREKLEQAIAELKRGVPFEKVVQKYSDGPSVKNGGEWDWMEAGNLADTKLEKKLFAMPLNQFSEIHEGPTSFCIVRITAREPDGRKPLGEVQDEIREILMNEQNERRKNKLFKELFTNVVIESQYSLPNFIPEDKPGHK